MPAAQPAPQSTPQPPPQPTPRPDERGVLQDWVDAYDQPHRVGAETVAALHAAIGSPPPDLEDRAPLVTRPGRRLGLGPVEVECEDGVRRSVGEVLPGDFPLGYHRLRTAAGVERRLIVSPGRCWLPEEQQWGWTVQLYGVHSAGTEGIGDLADLRRLRVWTEELGGGFLLVNPLHAVAPTQPQEASPYLPATRRFRNPLYLRVAEVPGADPDAVAGLPRGGELVDRDVAWAAKRAVLHDAFERSGAEHAEGLEEWRSGRGPALQEFVVWCALAEQHGPDWRAWPEPVRDPHAAPVARFAEQHREVVAFHAWLQLQLDRQLADATGDLTVLQDLPIGVSGGGADAWAWQDVLAGGVSVGAPPDLLNSTGQDWGSPPLVPWRLREADYEPFVESVRATIAGAGGLRIDHVLGLFRLWWVPQGRPATDGGYVVYPHEDLLDIVALESHRARAVVVGEDLGTVPPGVREELAERGMLSYRLLWFEEDEPAAWPRSALAAVTTHDLPTVAGLWTGSDAEDQLASTSMSEQDVRSGREGLLAQLGHGADLPSGSTAADAVHAAYARLAQAPCLLLAASLEDAVTEERRPNVPGTVERDNWRIPLRLPLEDLVGSAPARALAGLLDEAVRRDGVSPRA